MLTRSAHGVTDSANVPRPGLRRASSLISLRQTPHARCWPRRLLGDLDSNTGTGLLWRAALHSEVKEEAAARRRGTRAAQVCSSQQASSALSEVKVFSRSGALYLCTPSFSRQPGNSLSASPGNDSNARANSLCSLANSIGSAPAFQHSYDCRSEIAPAAGLSM